MISLARKIKRQLVGSEPLETPRKWMSSKAYAEQFGAKWHPVYKHTAIEKKIPTYYGDTPQEYRTSFESQLCQAYPELGVLELNQGHLIGSDGWIVSREGYLLPEHSWHGLNIDKIKVPQNLTKAKRSSLVCLSLASTWSHSNYAHFLLEAVPRFNLFQKSGLSLEDIDRIYCPLPKSPNAKLLLEKLGVPIKKCVINPFLEDERYRVDMLIAPSFPGFKRNFPEWIVDSFRQVLNQPLPIQNRRLYISRGTGSRKPRNEEELLKILSKYNFEVYNPTEHVEPQNDFSAAAVIVGAHGAGLANLVFCQPNTKVFELIPSDHISIYYFSLSEAVNLCYGCLICPSLEERDPSSFGPSPFDFHVNLQEFEEALIEMLKNV